ncbi:ribosomal L28 family-domain-containing protein [Annulohypoxylon maeteangense]|uniref:ribosomal L28 family-domain-containing protein n=1 Tax=Annulohypoxylon maeteangense TaxID=1927788 RepID=UPI0020080AF3|nr:ribosomal L28 family-domain-containing protein [Annulohypoxylon maeteangense]KAI0880162.1 ribosomal L28 family-domain-containing protein [Annulohypoxylon maeteangense]
MPPIQIPAASLRCCLLSTTLTSTPTYTLSHASTTSQTPIHNTIRGLSTTSPLSRQRPSYLSVPPDLIPDYPYGPFRTYKQANQGLFGGQKTRYGNVVAEKYGNKSRTSWLPNRHMKRLWSPSLNAFIRTRMTTRVLRTIDRLGGIDEYLLGSKAQRIKELGPAGWALRWKIIQTPAIQERFARERAAMGLPPKEVETIELPSELAAEGFTSNSVLTEVEEMIEREDEFVIGEIKEGEEVVVKADAAEEVAKEVDFMKEENPKESESTKTPGP